MYKRQLLALRTLYAPSLPDVQLEHMAAALGSDVPFFIRGGTALARGRGEHLTPMPRLRDGWFVIVKPPEGFSTPAMYRRLDDLPPVSYTHLDVYKRQPRDCVSSWDATTGRMTA